MDSLNKMPRPRMGGQGGGESEKDPGSKCSQATVLCKSLVDSLTRNNPISSFPVGAAECTTSPRLGPKVVEDSGKTRRGL